MESVAFSSETATFADGNYAVLADVAVCSEASFAHVAIFVLKEFAQYTFFTLKFRSLELSRSGVCR